MANGVDTANLVDEAPLTEREREVARLVAAGLTNGEIAERLGITFATAKWHVSQVLSKLEVEHREEIARRLAAPSRGQRRGWRWNAWGGLPFLKGLGIAAAVVPVGVVAVAGVLVLGSRGDTRVSAPLAEGTPFVLAASTIPPATVAPPRPAGIIGPPTRPHTCDLTESLAPLRPGTWLSPDHSGCDFSGVTFVGTMLNGADLSNADLSGATFRGGSLYFANLSGANLRGAWFIEAVMGFTDFSGADLTGAHFTNSLVDGAWTGATCPDGDGPRGQHGCVGTPGMENLPTTRSTAAARALVGQKAPGFSLSDAADSSVVHRLDDYTGKVVVLWWFADWCADCGSLVREAQRLTALYPNVEFLGMSMDETPAAALKFAAENDLQMPVAMDSRFLAASAYEVIASSTAVVVRADGTFAGFALFNSWDHPTLQELLDVVTRPGP